MRPEAVAHTMRPRRDQKATVEFAARQADYAFQMWKNVQRMTDGYQAGSAKDRDLFDRTDRLLGRFGPGPGQAGQSGARPAGA